MADIFELLRSISKKEEPIGSPEYIVACLGNPGREYERTRHNAGFMFASYFCQKKEFDISRSRYHALVGVNDISGKKVLFVCPQTFMNASGMAVREAADFYKIPPEKIIVVCDDVSFDPGKLRIRRKGSDGGHKGLRDIIYQLNSDNFPRIKLGVGAKPQGYDMADWVLGRLPEDDQKKLSSRFDDVAAAIALIIDGRCEEAMNKFN